MGSKQAELMSKLVSRLNFVSINKKFNPDNKKATGRNLLVLALKQSAGNEAIFHCS